MVEAQKEIALHIHHSILIVIERIINSKKKNSKIDAHTFLTKTCWAGLKSDRLAAVSQVGEQRLVILTLKLKNWEIS